jgi:AcrR family transcriptional regulator
LIAAAREVFAESGFQAPLNSIAKRAGVGQGSLYRHFPDRVALAVAVFEDNITDLEAVADDPAATVSDFFDRATAQAIGSPALIDMISLDREDDRTQHLGIRVVAVVDTLLARDKSAGRIRPDIESDDVMLALSMLAIFLSRSEPVDRDAAASRARALFEAAFHPQ